VLIKVCNYKLADAMNSMRGCLFVAMIVVAAILFLADKVRMVWCKQFHYLFVEYCDYRIFRTI